MTTKESRIAALELATDGMAIDSETLVLQQMPDEELERRVREILAKHDPPAADDMSEDAEIERRARKLMSRRDAERARQ